VDAKPIKQALITWTTKWIYLYTHYLQSKVCRGWFMPCTSLLHATICLSWTSHLQVIKHCLCKPQSPLLHALRLTCYQCIVCAQVENTISDVYSFMDSTNIILDENIEEDPSKAALASLPPSLKNTPRGLSTLEVS